MDGPGCDVVLLENYWISEEPVANLSLVNDKRHYAD